MVNLFEFIIPHFVVNALSINPNPFNIAGGLMLFCVDILAFAGLSFILMGILKKFEISNKKLIIIAIAMSIVGTLLKGIDFGNNFVNLFFAYFIGCTGGFTAFPLSTYNVICLIIIGNHAIGSDTLQGLISSSHFIMAIAAVLTLSAAILLFYSNFTMINWSICVC